MKAFVQRKCKSPGQDSTSRISPSSSSSKHGSSTPSQGHSRRNIFSPNTLVSRSPFSTSRPLCSDTTSHTSASTEEQNTSISSKSKSSGFKWLLERRKSTPPIKIAPDSSSIELETPEITPSDSAASDKLCKTSDVNRNDGMINTENTASWDITLSIREEDDGLVEREVQEHGSSSGFMHGGKHHFMSLFRLTSSRNSVSPPNRLQSPDSVATVTSISSGMGGPSPVSRGTSPGSGAHIVVSKEKLHDQPLQQQMDSTQKFLFIRDCPAATNSPDSGLEDGGRRSTGLFPGELKPTTCSTEIVVEEEYSEPQIEGFILSPCHVLGIRPTPLRSPLYMSAGVKTIKTEQITTAMTTTANHDGAIPLANVFGSGASSSSDLNSWTQAQAYSLQDQQHLDLTGEQRPTFHECATGVKRILRNATEDDSYATPSSIHTTNTEAQAVKRAEPRSVSSIELIEREEVTPTNPLDGNTTSSKRGSLSTVGTPKSTGLQENVFNYFSTKENSPTVQDSGPPADAKIPTSDVLDVENETEQLNSCGENITLTEVQSSPSAGFQPINILSQQTCPLSLAGESSMFVHFQNPVAENDSHSELGHHSPSQVPPPPPSRLFKMGGGVSLSPVSSTRPQGAIAVLRHHPASPFSPLPPRSSVTTAHTEPLPLEEKPLFPLDSMHLGEKGDPSLCDFDTSPNDVFTDGGHVLSGHDGLVTTNLSTKGFPCVDISSITQTEIFTPFRNLPPVQSTRMAPQPDAIVYRISRLKSNSTEQLQHSGYDAPAGSRMTASIVVQKYSDPVCPTSPSNVYQRQWSAPITTSVIERTSAALLTVNTETKEAQKPVEEDGPSSGSGTTDSWSTTDSYEEPWDVRHRRMIQELTSSRLLDPSSIRPAAYSVSRPSTETPKAAPTTTSSSSSHCPALTHHPPVVEPGIRAVEMSHTTSHSTSAESRHVSHTCTLPASQHSALKFSSSESATSSIRPITNIINTSSAVPHGSQREMESTSHDEESYSNEINVNLPLEEQYWYHGDLSRSRAEELLQSVHLGGFLVRRSETNPSAYSLSIRHHQGYLHMIISRVPSPQRTHSSSQPQPSVFILGQHSQPFPNVPVMMRHYQHHILPIRGADAITLGEPVALRMGNLRNPEHVMVPQARRRRE